MAMSESSPWTVDHPGVQAILQSIRPLLDIAVSPEAVCRILQGIDKHRDELRFEADDFLWIPETAEALDAIGDESGQPEEIVMAVVMVYCRAVGVNDLRALRRTADDPLVQALASTLSLRPAVVLAVLRHDHEFFAREGLSEEALLRRVTDAMMIFYFGELPSDDAP
jgi:hypothetical protein